MLYVSMACFGGSIYAGRELEVCIQVVFTYDSTYQGYDVFEENEDLSQRLFCTPLRYNILVSSIRCRQRRTPQTISPPSCPLLYLRDASSAPIQAIDVIEKLVSIWQNIDISLHTAACGSGALAIFLCLRRTRIFASPCPTQKY